MLSIFQRADVVASLRARLEDSAIRSSVRYWVTIIAQSYPDSTLVNGLRISLASTDEGIAEAAETALGWIEETNRHS